VSHGSQRMLAGTIDSLICSTCVPSAWGIQTLLV